MECKFILENSFLPLAVKRTHAGSIVYPPGGTCGPRMKGYYQLVLIHTGCMDVTVDGVAHHIAPGQLVLMKPKHFEYFEFSKDQETWHRWIDIDVETFPDETLAYFENTPFSIPISSEMNKITDMILTLLKAGNLENDIVLRCLGMSAIALYVTECLSNVGRNCTHPTVYFTKNKIHDRFQDDLTLDDLALEANVSPQHLIRLFNKYENKTPIQYLWFHRVERGVDLLRYTGLSIKEITQRTGFQTSYHFARVVKKHTGFTPTQLREQSWLGFEKS
jgi:AraC-like DNA-binding protein